MSVVRCHSVQPARPSVVPAAHRPPPTALFLTLPSPPVYLVNPSGEFAALWPKDVTIPLLSDAVSRAVKD